MNEAKDLDLVEIKDNQIVVSSLQIAEHFGKEHKHVLDAIRKEIGYAEKSADPLDAKMFMETTYVHPQNKQEYPIIFMNRDGFSLIVMGFTGKKASEWKRKYIKAFNQMEEMLKQQSIPKNFTPIELATAEFDSTLKFAQLLEKCGVEIGIARIHAMNVGKNHYKELTDKDIQEIQRALPPIKDNNIAHLTPTNIAEKINEKSMFDIVFNARAINKALSALGYQTSNENGWKITDKAKNLANIFPFENNNHTGYQIRWKNEVINILIEYFKNTYV